MDSPSQPEYTDMRETIDSTKAQNDETWEESFFFFLNKTNIQNQTIKA